MNVLKAAQLVDQERARSFKVEPRQAPPSALEAELAQARAHAARQAEELGALKAELAVLEDQRERGFADGLAKGRQEGRAAALQETETATAEHLARVERSALAAEASFKAALQSLERLAPALALIALRRVLKDPGSRADLVAGIVRTQLAVLSQRGVLQIEVAGADFDDPQSLALLDEALVARPGVEIRLCDELASGACRFRLEVGGVDAGVDQQWKALSTLLNAMAEGEA